MAIGLSEHFNYKKLIRFTIPTISMMLFTSIYGIIDGFFISNYVGSDAFTAVNIIFPAIMIIGSVGFMIGAGGGALVSKTLGEGKRDTANRYFSMLIYLELIIGVVFSIIAGIFIEPIGRFLGATDNLIDYSVTYGIILLVGTPAFMLQNSFQSFIVVAEKPKFGLVVTVAAGLTNIVLDFLFVGIFSFGIEGAAFATIISQFVGALIPLVFFIRKNNTYLRLKITKFELRPILKTCANGSSEMIANVSLNLVNVLYNLQLMKYAGPSGVAAFGVIMYVGFIFVGVYLGYSAGVSPIIGYHYGADNKKELKSLFKKSVIILAVAALVMTSIGEIFAPALVNIFVGYDKELAALSVRALRLYALCYAFCWFSIFVSAFFTSLNNGFISGLVSFLRTCLFQVVMILVLPIFFEIDGLWSAIVFAEALGIIVSLICVFTNRKKYGYF